MGFFNWRKWVNRKPRSSRRAFSPRPRLPLQRLELERLEERLAPTVDIWSGAAGNGKWSNPGNWSNGIPTPGSDLVFPANLPSTALTSNNDLSTGFLVNSITISGSKFAL